MKNNYSLLLLVVLLLFTNCSSNPELKIAESLVDKNLDSAYLIIKGIDSKKLNKASDKALYALLYCQISDKKEIYDGSDSLISIATDYYGDNDPERAAKAWFYKSRIAKNDRDEDKRVGALLEAMNYSNRIQENMTKYLILAEKANVYMGQSKYDSAILYFNKSEVGFKRIGDKRNLFLLNINKSYCYYLLKNIDSAVYYCNGLLSKYDIKDVDLTTVYYRTYAAILSSQGKFYESINLLKRIPLTHNELYDDNATYIIAKNYFQINKYDSMFYYFSKLNSKIFIEEDYYLILKDAYKKKHDYKSALYYSEKLSNAIDSINKHSINESFAGLEKKYNYQKLELKNNELELKNFRSGIVILICLLFISAGFLTVLVWRNTNRKRQLKIERQLKDNEIVRAEKEHENAALLEKQLNLQRIIFTNIEQYRTNLFKTPVNIRPNYSLINNEQFYAELFTVIDLQHDDFSKRLTAKYPQLTETDVFICCLLLAGFETGMIASILQIKVESMNIKRSRLRKKLDIDNQINLLDFLRNF